MAAMGAVATTGTVREAGGGSAGAELGIATMRGGILELGPAFGQERFNNGLGDRLRFEVVEKTYAVGGFDAIGSIRGVDVVPINAISGVRLDPANVNVVVSDLRSFPANERSLPDGASAPKSIGASAEGGD